MKGFLHVRDTSGRKNRYNCVFCPGRRAVVRADKSLSPFEIRLYRYYRVVHGVRIALAFILTFLLVRIFDVPEGTWPLITLVVLMGPISFWGKRRSACI